MGSALACVFSVFVCLVKEADFCLWLNLTSSLDHALHFSCSAVIEPTDNGAEPEKAPKNSNAKKPQNLKKRKNESSSEDEENSDYESDDCYALNGSRKSLGRGKVRSASGKKGRGRGRGRPASEASSAGGRGTGRRGRPKKS